MNNQKQMKKVAFICYLVLVSSCLSSCMITKCRYSSGFRIDFGNKQKSTQSIGVKHKKKGLNKFDNNTISDSIITDIEYANKPFLKNIEVGVVPNSIEDTQIKVEFLGFKKQSETQFIPKREVLKNIKTSKRNSKYYHTNKEKSSIGILKALLEIIKFIFFAVFAIVVLLLSIICAAFLASATTGFLLGVLLLIVVILFVLMLAALYQSFGYGPWEDVIEFFANLFLID